MRSPESLSDTETRSDPERNFAGFVFVGVMFVICFLATAGSQLPAYASPSFLRGEANAFSPLWSQGWDFFARETTADKFAVYQQDGTGRWRDGSLHLQDSTATDLGLSRLANKQLIEITLIELAVPATDWHECGTESDCILAASSSPPAWQPRHVDAPTLCGAMIVTRIHPTVHSGQAWTPVAAARIDVSCR